ncbi:MAG: SPW repeat protein [Gallionella sp.]
MYVIVGVWLVVSPAAMGYFSDSPATANSWGIGGVLIVFNLIAISRVFGAGQAVFNILLGGWLILSPYLLDFAADKEAANITIAIGVLVVAFACWQIYDATKSRKRP